jgi:hypothetical protein
VSKKHDQSGLLCIGDDFGEQERGKPGHRVIDDS